MEQILEYILQHYTWFLGGCILILLAIIGYYADKTNFGQGKTNQKNSDKEPKDLSDARLSDVIGALDNKIDETHKGKIEQTNNSDEVSLNQNKIENLANIHTNENVIGKEYDEDIKVTSLKIPNENYSDVDDTIKNQHINVENNDQLKNISSESFSNEKVNDNIDLFMDSPDLNSDVEINEENDSLLNDEVFHKFNEEFNLILPKKELINNDLLSDIDDLGFDKTQKIDLSGVPDLDDIELPKIKKLVSEEEDIWKF